MTDHTTRAPLVPCPYCGDRTRQDCCTDPDSDKFRPPRPAARTDHTTMDALADAHAAVLATEDGSLARYEALAAFHAAVTASNALVVLSRPSREVLDEPEIPEATPEQVRAHATHVALFLDYADEREPTEGVVCTEAWAAQP